MRCLGCYQDLIDEPTEYHSSCARRVFGTSDPPIIDIDLEHLRERSLEVPLHGAVPGVQAKISVARAAGDRKRLTIVGFKGEYILKPASATFAELPENEDLTMHLAELADIRTAPHALVRTRDGQLAYITRRFDRKFRSHDVERFAVEDMCQLSGKLTENKYQGSMVLIARLVRKYSTYPALDARILFEITLFSYLVGNSDMHLKNFSLIRTAKNIISFSPAYDLLAVQLAVPNDREEFALTVNQKKRNISRKDLDAFGEYCELAPSVRDFVYASMQKALPPIFDTIARSFLSEPMRDRYRALLTERANSLALA